MHQLKFVACELALKFLCLPSLRWMDLFVDHHCCCAFRYHSEILVYLVESSRHSGEHPEIINERISLWSRGSGPMVKALQPWAELFYVLDQDTRGVREGGRAEGWRGGRAGGREEGGSEGVVIFLSCH